MKTWSLFVIAIGIVVMMYANASANPIVNVVLGLIICFAGILLYRKAKS
mgnify:CR=1 FL=1